MDVIPAIDILEGKCVRLRQGNFASQTVYSNDPVEVAKRFQEAGLKRVHLIDLDGAKEGAIQNWKTIEKIANHTTLSIECGGGVRTREDIEQLLRAGVDKIIIGSLAITEPEKFKEIVRSFRKSIVVGVDVKGSALWYHGWQKKSQKELYPFLLQTAHFGTQSFICTDIDRDGTLEGPNLALYEGLVENFPFLSIVASGGVRNIEDIKNLAEIGVAGVIIGKALYENKIAIKELI